MHFVPQLTFTSRFPKPFCAGAVFVSCLVFHIRCCCCCCSVAKACPTLLWPPWTVACQALLSMGFSRQEHWSGLPYWMTKFFFQIESTHIVPNITSKVIIINFQNTKIKYKTLKSWRKKLKSHIFFQLLVSCNKFSQSLVT